MDGTIVCRSSNNPVPRLEYSKSESENIDLTLEDPSLLTGLTYAAKHLELKSIIKSIEMERVTLNTAHSKLSGEVKQGIKATLTQSKEINALQTEMGSIYSMLKDIHSHFMPNSRPIPHRPN
jgi:hypothetical protein